MTAPSRPTPGSAPRQSPQPITLKGLSVDLYITHKPGKRVVDSAGAGLYTMPHKWVAKFDGPIFLISTGARYCYLNAEGKGSTMNEALNELDALLRAEGVELA